MNLANPSGIGTAIGAHQVGRWSSSPTALAPIIPPFKRRILACAAASRANNNGRSLDARKPREEPEAATKQPVGRTNAMNWRRQNGGGNAHRNYERYLALAREATLNGDRIEAENYYQHAEHYFRVMRERTN